MLVNILAVATLKLEGYVKGSEKFSLGLLSAEPIEYELTQAGVKNE